MSDRVDEVVPVPFVRVPRIAVDEDLVHVAAGKAPDGRQFTVVLTKQGQPTMTVVLADGRVLRCDLTALVQGMVDVDRRFDRGLPGELADHLSALRALLAAMTFRSVGGEGLTGLDVFGGVLDNLENWAGHWTDAQRQEQP